MKDTLVGLIFVIAIVGLIWTFFYQSNEEIAEEVVHNSDVIANICLGGHEYFYIITTKHTRGYTGLAINLTDEGLPIKCGKK